MPAMLGDCTRCGGPGFDKLEIWLNAYLACMQTSPIFICSYIALEKYLVPGPGFLKRTNA